ncbi:uncharacterized protein CIMG_13495 [Coccidioides immitis RS]|uniref:Uncharacterized protein n=3 Tax=Coccidioides immitis TaxID=5501 RepID=J3K0C2_COCIM|nr:uncharacterized protein CIMG_13495 [Coccidioides immitis RS]EAS27280.3 hypothetical protein CIMG_13495 [Coccidioides immitis RS]KMP09246.1 hypothetical protein CIRG_09416 [Coccidioides immitis RMSCC 2394]KMU92251.1 hypothetical protein CIHG_10058 [Coccidioides immitis H538.4]TPX20132.1 hypothetical protein DIZ76_016020 [Coccidioides immitis]
MLRCVPRVLRPSSSIGLARPTARYLHQVTGDFLNYDAKGIPVSTKVPVFIGDPGETFVLITTDIGRALHAASHDRLKLTALPSGKAGEDSCPVTFFHDTQHFGFGPSSYPRLHIPINFPRQTDSNTSPATLHLTGNMHDIVLDGTPDAKFFELANASGRELQGALDELKDR